MGAPLSQRHGLPAPHPLVKVGSCSILGVWHYSDNILRGLMGAIQNRVEHVKAQTLSPTHLCGKHADQFVYS